MNNNTNKVSNPMKVIIRKHYVQGHKRQTEKRAADNK